MPVLTYENELLIGRNGQHIHPIRIFEDIVFGDLVAVRQSETVASHGQPRTAEQVFAVGDLPAAFLFLVILHGISVFLAKDSAFGQFSSGSRG